jgi:hypothetical protein
MQFDQKWFRGNQTILYCTTIEVMVIISNYNKIAWYKKIVIVLGCDLNAQYFG